MSKQKFVGGAATDIPDSGESEQQQTLYPGGTASFGPGVQIAVQNRTGSAGMFQYEEGDAPMREQTIPAFEVCVFSPTDGRFSIQNIGDVDLELIVS
jgi:hypothetical protein